MVEQKLEHDLTEFSDTEISELQKYIEVQVHVSVLQKVYMLTDIPIDKAEVFILVYRILVSCKNYASTIELKNKLDNLLKNSEETYNKVRPLVLRNISYTINYGKEALKRQILEIVCNPEDNKNMNKIIDAFLIFGEKIELNRAEDFMGVDMETDQGKEAKKELEKIIKEDNI